MKRKQTISNPKEWKYKLPFIFLTSLSVIILILILGILVYGPKIIHLPSSIFSTFNSLTLPCLSCTFLFFCPLFRSLYLFLFFILHLIIQHWRVEVGTVASAKRAKCLSQSVSPHCMWTLYLQTLFLRRFHMHLFFRKWLIYTTLVVVIGIVWQLCVWNLFSSCIS